MRHPAKYTDSLIPVFARMLKGSTRILDPFAGTGKVFFLERLLPGVQIEALELEPEWATMHPRTTIGNVLSIPWDNNYFDAICTSPCYGNRMADHHDAKDGSSRNTYAHALGRKPHCNNAGLLQWGEDYRRFHIRAWSEESVILFRY